MDYDIFTPLGVKQWKERVDNLHSESQALWGEMTVDTMLAHCSVSYEMDLENRHPRPGAFKRFMLKMFVKKIVVGDTPYKQNSPSADAFKHVVSQGFHTEKERLKTYIDQVAALGKESYEGRESHSFGKLTSRQWSTLYGKHLDHHLKQFGV